MNRSRLNPGRSRTAVAGDSGRSSDGARAEIPAIVFRASPISYQSKGRGWTGDLGDSPASSVGSGRSFLAGSYVTGRSSDGARAPSAFSGDALLMGSASPCGASWRRGGGSPLLLTQGLEQPLNVGKLLIAWEGGGMP